MKKNIAIVVPQLAGGGAERVASNLLLYLSDEKYEKGGADKILDLE